MPAAAALAGGREEIEPRPDRYDTRGIDVGMAHVVVALDVVDIGRRCGVRYQVEVP